MLLWNILYLKSQTDTAKTDPIDSNMPNTHHAGSLSPGQTKTSKTDPSLVLPKRVPTHHACDGLEGIYHIAMGDIGGAAGTVFFQFVIGQIRYAERNRLKPWVHFNNVSYIVYDDVVHGGAASTDHISPVRLTAMTGRNASLIERPNGHWRDVIPGPLNISMPIQQQKLVFTGTGVWEHYFEPISDFVPGDRSCEPKLYVTLSLKLITPGIHGFVSWAPKCWRYHYLPDYVTKPHIPIAEWLEPQRVMGAETVQKYLRLKPYLHQAAQHVNPGCRMTKEASCLGLHIRHSDKAAGRRVIETIEFLPYAEAFLHSGGRHIYVATDSTQVLKEIHSTWPKHVTENIRTLGDDVVRSSNDKAVFDIGKHHRTNQEVLIEIIALSMCQFQVHGLSAVSESSVWMNIGLHNRSVNLEDPDHLSVASFGSLVQMSLRGEPEDHWPRPRGTDRWWAPSSIDHSVQKLHPVGSRAKSGCNAFDAFLHISKVGDRSAAGAAFFIDVLNQLIYADDHNMIPKVHLRGNDSLVYDRNAHDENTGANEDCRGVWGCYFDPVSNLDDEDPSCSQKSRFNSESSGLPLSKPSHTWPVKAWQYDDIFDELWNPSALPLKELYEPMRRRASAIVNKYYRFRPHIVNRALEVNPVTAHPCLSVHIRVGDKLGKHISKVKADAYLPYLEAFARAGGKSIFLATDSHRALQYIEKNFPGYLLEMIRTQGKYVVRTTKDWATHFIEDHHRVNSEALVDILAMSRCNILLHSHSTVAEAAIYLNFDLHNNSVNLEDPDKISPERFETVSKEILMKDDPAQPLAVIAEPSRNALRSSLSTKTVPMNNATILFRPTSPQCRSNAVLYLAQKQHSSYSRDSYKLLLNSMDLLNRNYLSIHNHTNNTDLFVFHNGDFGAPDLKTIEEQLGINESSSASHVAVYLVDLNHSHYWTRPKAVKHDDPKYWHAYPLFSEGYRRMMHWYAIDIWRFFQHWNEKRSCSYRYLFRLDEDSYIHSPIQYDIFDFFRQNQYVYGYRLCAYEMKITRNMWKQWHFDNPNFVAKRKVEEEMCGFYNNMFVADLQFFNSEPVSKFLSFIDRRGVIYRRRLGDLMIHTMTVLMFAPPDRIHRFLDFTYEHGTWNETDGCLLWGGIQAGYLDPKADHTLDDFYRNKLLARRCPYNASYLHEEDLSPSYAHVPNDLRGKVALHTIVAGKVELPAGKGILSG